jgi:hypothetical protein
MMKHQETYERAVLHGMLIYNDLRSVGYLKPSNFRHKTGEIENSKIFEVLGRVLDYAERVREFKHGAASLFTALVVDKGYMSDYLGVNTPKYSLLILENIFKEAVRVRLKKLSSADVLYAPIVQNVYAEIELSNMDCFEMSENVLAYFRSIGFTAGVLSFEELAENIDERVKQINQNYEVDMLTTRLKRYCDEANKRHFIGYLDTIKQGITV